MSLISARAPWFWNLLRYWEQSHSTWLHRLCTAQLQGGADHIDYDEKCTPSVQGILLQPHVAALPEKLENALPFNKHPLGISCVENTVLGSRDTRVIKKDTITFYMELTFWQSREGRVQGGEQKPFTYIVYQMVVSAQENSKAKWWGNEIPAVGELLFETRLARRLHCWHFWSEAWREWGNKLFI